jgi:hypothetical protein
MIDAQDILFLSWLDENWHNQPAEIKRKRNDLCRTAAGVIDAVMFSETLSGWDQQDRSRIWEMTEVYDTFTPENDPWEEHDMGFFWYKKDGADYYLTWAVQPVAPNRFMLWMGLFNER